jgi:hypothetical protein
MVRRQSIYRSLLTSMHGLQLEDNNTSVMPSKRTQTIVVSFSLGPSLGRKFTIYSAHIGLLLMSSYNRSRLLGDGQVVIDVKSFRRSNPSLDVWA